MQLQITKVIAENQTFKSIYVQDGTTEYLYNGRRLVKSIITKDRRTVRKEYTLSEEELKKDRFAKPVPKSLKKLVEEMEFLRFSLLENAHVEAEIIQ